MNQVNYDAIVASIREAMKRDDLPEWHCGWRQLKAPVVTTPPPMLAQFIAKVGAEVKHRDGTQEACSENSPVYNPLRGDITLPPVEAYESEEEYLLAAFHELTHWTAHPSRIFKRMRMVLTMMALAHIEKTGKEEIPKDLHDLLDVARCHEEMIAEFGSVFLAAHYGVPVNIERHAVYIKNYFSVFKSAPDGGERIITDAIKRAKEAVEWLLAKQVPVAEPELQEAA